MSTQDWKEAAEKWEASLPRGVTITVQQIFQAGAAHGYEVGNIEADTQWSEKVLELEAANIQLKQRIEDAEKIIDADNRALKEVEEKVEEKAAEIMKLESECDQLRTRIEDAERALSAILAPYTEHATDADLGHLEGCYCDHHIALAYFARHAEGEHE